MFCGGRGATTITQALIRQTNAKITLIINCYDNGLSTGRIRNYLHGILGPSDFRKNLSTVLSAIEQNEVSNFLEHRIESFDSQTLDLLNLVIKDSKLDLNLISATQWQHISTALHQFRLYELEKLEKFDYSDCAIGNLIIAGQYLKNLNDINHTFQNISKTFLGTNSRFEIINATDGTNLYLCGKSTDNKWILSEEEIVENPGKLRISEVFLTAKQLKVHSKIDDTTWISPNLNPEAQIAIQNADIIIYGPGTPTSSLYPTYLTRNLGKIIAANQNALKLFISNILPDKDDPFGNLESRIEGTISHLTRNEKIDKHDLINLIFCSKNEKNLISNLNQNSIEIITDQWVSSDGRHLGPAIINQLDKIVVPRFKLRAGFISIVIPILEFREDLHLLIMNLANELKGLNCGSEILLVSRLEINEFQKEYFKSDYSEIRFICIKNNSRKSELCASGIHHSKGDLIGLFDVSQGFSVSSLMQCLKFNIINHELATIAIRVSKTRNLRHQIRNSYNNQKLLGYLSYWGGILISTLVLLKFHRFFIDPLSSLKVFNKKDVYNLKFKGKGMDFELELIKELTKRNVTIVEIPVEFNPNSLKRDFKLALVNGFIAIKYLLFIRKTS